MKRYELKAVKNTVAQDHGIVTAELKMVEKDDGEWVRYEEIEDYRWIPIEEQRPEKYQVVMCKCLEAADQSGYFTSEKDWGDEGMSYHFKSAVTNEYISVLAWFPLPKYEYEDDL